MEIIFSDREFEGICQDCNRLVKKYGFQNATKITQRIEQLRAIETLGHMLKYRIGRCHPLKGDFKGLFALDIEHPYRLIIEPVFEVEVNKAKVDYYCVKIIKIIGVKDYHG